MCSSKGEALRPESASTMFCRPMRDNVMTLIRLGVPQGCCAMPHPYVDIVTFGIPGNSDFGTSACYNTGI